MKHLKDIICAILNKPIGAILLTIFTFGGIKKIIKECKNKQTEKVKPEKKKKEEPQVTAIIIEEKIEG